jgi:hypothetical protein
MDSISATIWQRKGSCVVFDRHALGPLIEAGGILSLRQALSWTTAPLPAEPPGKSILISGLETILHTLPPQETHDFLLRRIQPLIIKLQNTWTECGLIFGFASPAQVFIEDAMSDEVLYKRSDQQKIRLSEGLWDGSATVNMKRIVRETSEQGKEETLGWYVARIS